MSTLRLRVDKYVDSDGGPPPQVFARIRDLDETRRGTSGFVIDRMIPISGQSNDAAAITLSPGHYFVEVRLPSGEVLSDDVRVPADGEGELVLKTEDSPHEWLGWQHLMGNISSQPTQSAPPPSAQRGRIGSPASVDQAKRVGFTDKSLRKRSATSKKTVSVGPGRSPPTRVGPVSPTKERGPSPGRRSIGPAKVVRQVVLASAQPHTQVGASIYWVDHIASLLVPGHAKTDVWSALGRLDGTPDEIIAKLNAGAAARAIKSVAQDATIAMYHVVHGKTALANAQSLNSSRDRDFVAIKRSNGVELLSLPMPWREVWSGREAVVEIAVQETIRDNDFATSVAIRDERLGVLLGFLASGALPAVKRIAETATDLLFEKTQNPLAAAAGGYALVGTAVDASEQAWHRWIENLMNHFQYLPDGAIQYATLRLRMRRNLADIDVATKALKTAFHRGIPAYGLGVRWLLEGLERIASRDEEASKMRDAVQVLASRLHPQSPFTIFRLGGR